MRRYNILVTISAHNKKIYVKKRVIDKVIDDLKDFVKIKASGYEISGKYHQLHWHSICTTKVPMKKFYKLHKDFYVDVRQLYSPKDQVRALKYIQKEQGLHRIQEEQAIAENYYSNEYAF